MTIQVTAPAKRLALPDTLAPLTVVQAPDKQNLDPRLVDHDNALTAVIPTEGLEESDRFYIYVVGEAGTHPDASYSLDDVLLGGVRPREVNLKKGIVALLLDKKVTLTYKIVRGAQEKPSEPLELRVSALEVKVPVARILEAQDNGHGSELDLTTGTVNLTARLDRWPLLAKDQLVGVTLKGKDAEGNDHILTLLAPPEGTVSQNWENRGYHELPIDRGYLAGLGNNTTLTIEHQVAFDRGHDADAVVVFAHRTYAVKSLAMAKPFITGVKDSKGNDVAPEGTTFDTQLKFTGTVAEGGEVDIYDGVTRLGSATVSSTGWTYEATGLTAKTYSFKAKGLYGDEPESEIWAVTVQEATKPEIRTVKDSKGNDVAPEGTTFDTRLKFTGTVAEGEKVDIYDGDTRLGSATVSGTGWTYEATGLTAKAYTFKAKGLYGDEPESEAWAVTVRVATKPGISTVKDSKDQPISNPGTTFDTTLKLTGTVAEGEKVDIYDGNTRLGSATVSGTGWTYEATGLTAKTYSFKAKGLYGGEPESEIWAVTVQEATKPEIRTVKDSKGNDVAPEGATFDTQLKLTGTAAEGEKVDIYDGDTRLGSATVSGTGWTYEATGLTAKAYTFKAKGLYGDEPESEAWAVTVRVATKPGISTVKDSKDQPISNPGTTFDTTLKLTGTAAEGEKVDIYDGDTRLGSATVSGTGWTYEATGLTAKAYTFKAKGLYGDEPESEAWAVTVRVATKPGISTVKDSKDQPISNPGTTFDTTLKLTGTVAEGEKVDIYDGDTRLGSATVSGTGWTYEATGLTAKAYSFKAKGLYGDEPESEIWAVTVRAATKPGISTIKDSNDQLIGNPGTTFDTLLKLTGTAGVGEIVTIFSGDDSRGTLRADDGTWRVEQNSWGLGTLAIRVVASGLDSDIWRVTLIDVPLVISSIRAGDVDVPPDSTTTATAVTVKGTAAPNQFVTVFDGDLSMPTINADRNGEWEMPISGLKPGLHEIKAQKVDGTPSAIWRFTVVR
ncbi:hypothetical protein [Pseudomonas purpurea]|uniref:MSCRAMM family protein n=1 Tax=Pseudomonas purpurea TaxID=3136737 RepID=UPI003263C559